jgi:putative SOS response-associated peptidase YedK
LEQASYRANARCDPFGGRQASTQDDEVGTHSSWSKDDKLQYSTFNARSEDFRTKPSFRDAWKWGQRCLVVTDGFYEWKKLDAKGKQKQPYAIAMTDDGQMVMAGLWAKWKSPSGEEVLSCRSGRTWNAHLQAGRRALNSAGAFIRACLR